ncbi:MAG: PAS domain S-box protein, partial [Thiogranum sp.]|nr:PAS domain S-box protein [Thiogranum sp.]
MGGNTRGSGASGPSPEQCNDLLRNFLTHTADGYFLHDTDGHILDVNAAACNELGYSRNELLALNVADIEQRFSLVELRKRWDSLAPGRAYRFDAFHRRKNGSTVLVSGTSQRFELATGVAIVALVHPVSEPAPSAADVGDEQARQQDRYQQLRRAQTLAQLGTWEWDGESGRMTWDDTLCAIFGCTLEDYPATLDRFLETIHPDSRPVVAKALDATFTQKRPFVTEYRIVRPDGATRTVLDRGYISKVDAQGQVTAMYGIAQDITERARLEEQIEQSEARFRMLVEQSPDCFYVHDLQGRILDVSPGTCEELGYTREELLALNIREIEQAVGYDKLLEDWHAMVPGKHVILAGINRRKDGSEFPVEVHSRRFEVNDEPRILALARDISGQQSLARLMEIILHSTARKSGDDFLQLLVRELAEVLQLRMAFIARVIAPDPRRLRIVAMWQDGAFRDAFEYAIEGTPCERVFEEQLVVVRRDVQRRFPKDTWLREQGMQSYVAIAFYDIGANPLGHMG